MREQLVDLLHYVKNTGIQVIKIHPDGKFQGVESNEKSILLNGRFYKFSAPSVFGLRADEETYNFFKLFDYSGFDIKVNTVKEMVTSEEGVEQEVEIVTSLNFVRQGMEGELKLMDRRIIPQQFNPKELTYQLPFKLNGSKKQLISALKTVRTDNVGFAVEKGKLCVLIGDTKLNLISYEEKLKKIFFSRKLIRIMIEKNPTMMFNVEKGALRLDYKSPVAEYSFIMPAKARG